MDKIPTLQELLEAGVHFGHQVRRGNPRMRQYIYGAREGVHIIDLTLSEKYLKEAVDFSFQLGKEGKILLLVGTKKQAQGIIEDLAKLVDTPYLTNRWIGGFLTNFEEISRNIKRLKELREQKEKGQLKIYTKKEQLLIDRRMAQLERDLGGALVLDKMPDAIFVVDANKDDTAVKEAARVGVKVIAIADSNVDPTFIDFPIPGNDDAIKSIKILSEAVVNSYGEGKKQAGKDAVKAEQQKVKDDAKQKAEEEKLPEEVVEEVADAEEKIEKEVLEESKRVE